jgi:hypothetical protein
LNQILPVSLIKERKFYKLQQFGLNQIRRVLQKFPNKNQKKSEKRKRKKIERERRAGGSTSALLTKTAHGPLSPFPQTGTKSPASRR